MEVQKGDVVRSDCLKRRKVDQGEQPREREIAKLRNGASGEKREENAPDSDPSYWLAWEERKRKLRRGKRRTRLQTGPAELAGGRGTHWRCCLPGKGSSSTPDWEELCSEVWEESKLQGGKVAHGFTG